MSDKIDDDWFNDGLFGTAEFEMGIDSSDGGGSFSMTGEAIDPFSDTDD